MADITKVNVVLNGGAAVNVAAVDGSALSILDGATDITISSISGGAVIAGFNKGSVAYWTTDLVTP